MHTLRRKPAIRKARLNPTEPIVAKKAATAHAGDGADAVGAVAVIAKAHPRAQQRTRAAVTQAALMRIATSFRADRQAVRMTVTQALHQPAATHCR